MPVSLLCQPFRITSVVINRYLTITATRYGSSNLAFPEEREGRATIIPPSFRLSIKSSMRMLRRDCITTAFATMSRIQEPISAGPDKT